MPSPSKYVTVVVIPSMTHPSPPPPGLQHPLLPALSRVCLPQLDPTQLNTLKVILGGGASSEVVEVCINGSPSQSAADVLLNLQWPRVETTWVRAYILAIHPVERE